MSLITDIRAVSGNAVEQIAVRLAELPRPLLAAIGAGEMARERLTELGESIGDSLGERAAKSPKDVSSARSAAAEVVETMEKFAAQAPARAQELLATLPDKLAQFQAAAQSFSPDTFKETVDAYSQLAGMIYANLAERGDQRWSKVRASGLRPETFVEAMAAKVSPFKAPAAASAVTPVPAPASRKSTSPGVAAPATKPVGAATKPVGAATKPVGAATKPVGAAKPRAPRAAQAKTGASRPTPGKSPAKPAAASPNGPVPGVGR